MASKSFTMEEMVRGLTLFRGVIWESDEGLWDTRRVKVGRTEEVEWGQRVTGKTRKLGGKQNKAKLEN